MLSRHRVVRGFLGLGLLASILVGAAMAVFGSRSDVNPGEQAVALVSGLGMLVSGIVGGVGLVRTRGGDSMKVPLICIGSALGALLLGLTLGP